MNFARAFTASLALAAIVGAFAYFSALAMGGPLWGAGIGAAAFLTVFVHELLDR